jgi:A118 family predicted phage portal protein
MPLPGNNLAWPPKDLLKIAPVMQQWSAWYEGTPEALREAYSRGMLSLGVDPRLAAAREAQHRGIRGMLQRFWWGRPVHDLTQLQRDMLHVPVAADIAQASADLLYADPPTISSKSPSTQSRLEELADDGMYATLAESAELCAALGGSYLRVTWDKQLRESPFLTAVDADAAWPEFQWGVLRAVTFWRVLEMDGQTIWRHLERHELDLNGAGIISHGLYEGTPDNLGRAVPLSEAPSTAVFVDALNDDGVISTQSPGLAVTYVPNQRPQRRWRKDPLGCYLGRSDFDGVEGLMDALDEVYSSWMRDIRLGKARLVVGKSLLENLGQGNGALFDAEQEIYSPVNMLLAAKDGGIPMEQVQFAIRYAEHQATAQQLVDNILRTAGYSTQTFGEGTEAGGLRTATEVEQKERRSLLTRDRKTRLQRPAVGDVLLKLLAVDKALFNGKADVQRPDITFSGGVQETELTLAQTALALRQADAASTEILVALVHPDWDDQAVQQEAAKILAEKATTVPAPAQFGGFGATEEPEQHEPTGQQ